MNYSIIIAVENYLDTGISKVDFAESDAKEFAVSIKNIGYLDNRKQVLINSTATKTNIESKIRQTIKLLSEDDNLIFYFAGHGLANSDKNYITCYDTVLDDLVETSISIQYILTSFQDICKNVFYFLDSCHSGLNLDKASRGIYSDLNKSEFIDALKGKKGNILFSACKSNEYSYPISVYKHGVWTYHLIEVLNGRAEKALEKGSLLTVISLQNYLTKAVKLTIKEVFTKPKVQTPWMLAGLESDILIGDLSRVISKNIAPSPSIIDIVFLVEKTGNIKTLSGFRKKNTVPNSKDDSTESFVRHISHNELKEETENTIKFLRSEFSFKRTEITVAEGDGLQSIHTPEFEITISIDQHMEEYGEYSKTIKLSDLTDKEIIKDETFNIAFNAFFDCMIIKLDKPIKVTKLIDDLEDLEDSDLILNYPSDCSYCEIKKSDYKGSVMVTEDQLAIQLIKKVSPIELYDWFINFNENLISLNCKTKLIR